MRAMVGGRLRARRLVVLVAVGVLATAGAAVGGTLAVQSFTDAQGVYHGCVGNAGQLRVVQPSDACKGNETAIDWNRTGPQGPKGDTGDTGPRGPAGPGVAGSPCTFASGAQGTVQEDVAQSGAVTFTCKVTGSGLCPSPLPSYPNSTTACDPTVGVVRLLCDSGWVDANGQIADGCEQQVVNTPAVEVCNGIDDDHDGIVDDNLVDTPHWPHAVAGCFQGAWRLVACDPGWSDANGDPVDGCEKQL